MKTKIYCCPCKENVLAELCAGEELGRQYKLPKNLHFWKCENCHSFVGTHKVKNNDFAALGAIPTKSIRKMQKPLIKEIEAILNAKKSIPDAKEKLFNWLSKKMFFPSFRPESLLSQGLVDEATQLLKLINK